MTRCSTDMAKALTERATAIEGRALELAQEAVSAGHPWVMGLGTVPSSPTEAAAWWRAAATVAAYRDRWSVNGSDPVGAEAPVTSVEMLAQRRRALAACQRASKVARAAATNGHPGRPWEQRPPAPTVEETDGLVASDIGRSAP